MRVALTIAGSDSGAGAGIQADLKTFAAHGVYGTSAITAVTAQNSLGVTMAQALPADLVTAQIEAVVSDFGIHAAKTGMLPNAAIVEAVCAAIRDLDIPMLVVDPVMIAKSGDRLVDDEALAMMKTELVGLAFLVTPNIPEAEALTNIEIRTDQDREEAARRIVEMGARHAERRRLRVHRGDERRRAAREVPRERGGGAILMIASIWGRESGGRMTYNAVKAAEISLAKAMAQQLAKDNIRVNSVAPGSISFEGGSWWKRQQEDPQGIAEFIARDLPFGRFGTAEEVGSVVAFVASPKASWISGASITVDGCQSRSNL